METNGYGNESISVLRDEDRVRKRPAVIFGTNDIHGCWHSVFEIIANSIDEAREGYGDKIEITVSEDNIITVRDYGRGVPMEWNESEGEYNWKLIFCTLYASGKYDDGFYTKSMGLNGLGAAATQYASEFMTVKSYIGSKKYTMKFGKGRPIGKLQVEANTEGTSGTEITFRPDPEVFTDINLDVEYYLDVIRRQAMLNSGVEFILNFRDQDQVRMSYPKGIKGFVEGIVRNKNISSVAYFKGKDRGRETPDDTPYDVEMEIAVGFCRNIPLVEVYHNGSHLVDGGTGYDGFVRGVIDCIETKAKLLGKLKSGDNIEYRDIEDIICGVVYTSCSGTRTFFKNQTKTAINNKFIKQAVLNFVRQKFSVWMDENNEDAKKIVEEVVLNKQIRENAEAVKRKVVKKLSTSVEKFFNRPDKFVECASKNPEERELYIVEGDSARDSCKVARDGRFQAIMPIKGKIMNCVKEDITRILNSDVIIDLARTIGCGLEITNKYIKDIPKFDIKKLQYGKIIICTDADLDGMQIRCLVLAMIYRLMPTLIKMGKVYIAETPLYEIRAGETIVFAYSEAEKDVKVKELINSGVKENRIKLYRSKGLGENDPEMLAETTMRPETRRLIQVEYDENAESLRYLFEALLGADLEGRKEIIEENFDMEVSV